ncbi:MAG: hypothetical protein IKZ03_01960, partial [Clostridia bacterium]|nr:hypothetical protein [Clostridia bacterium]
MEFTKEAKRGLVIGNSTMSAAVTPGGRMYGRIVYNPPYFEAGNNSLREAGECGFAFDVDGAVKADCELNWNARDNAYPRYMADAAVTDDVDVSVLAYSPLSANNYELIFTPCTVTEYTFKNSSACDKTVKVTLEWHPTRDALRNSFGKAGEVKQIAEGHYIIESGDAFISAFGCAAGTGATCECGSITLTASVNVPAKSEAATVFLLGIFESNHRFKMKMDAASDVCKYVQSAYDEIRDEITDFVSIIPSIGDEKIYLYTRWYMQAAILLTKSAVTGEVMTMGYTEL